MPFNKREPKICHASHLINYMDVMRKWVTDLSPTDALFRAPTKVELCLNQEKHDLRQLRVQKTEIKIKNFGIAVKKYQINLNREVIKSRFGHNSTYRMDSDNIQQPRVKHHAGWAQVPYAT